MLVRKKIRPATLNVIKKCSFYNIVKDNDKYGPEMISGLCDDLWKHRKPKHHAGEFKIIMPPPNVTGDLHIGHALSFTLQDIFSRYNRMNNIETLWIPGFDHAGIATQIIVENVIESENKGSLKYLSRDDFCNECEKWSQLRIQNIKSQMNKLVLHPSWDHEYFTLNEKHSINVENAFNKLFKLKKIYRDKRIVNWSCKLQSTISDIEVEWKEINGETKLNLPGVDEAVTFGILYHILYKLESNCNDGLVVATTRPETILADVAVAVNPNDLRYSKYIGQNLINPITHRMLPIISDEIVDINFGTGVLKITPGHSVIDFDIGKRHNLPLIEVFDNKGNIKNTDYLEFNGVNRYKARNKIVDYLNTTNQILKIDKNYSTKIPFCSRSNDIIEYIIKPQWFYNVNEACNSVMEVLNKGLIEIFPENKFGIFENYLTSKEPWCISRQIKWGHKIPVGFDRVHNKWVCRQETEDINNPNVDWDNDVLDTWFSSGLIPLSCSNGSNSSEEQQYLSDNLITGYDIVPLWVCRMILMTLDLTEGKMLPFRRVILHGMICDRNGKKMSKSRGNVVNPIKLVDSFGGDSVRLGLFEQDITGNTVKFSEDRVNSCRKWMQKIWQTTRFYNLKWSEPTLQKSMDLTGKWSQFLDDNFSGKGLRSIDTWMLVGLYRLVYQCNESFKSNGNWHRIVMDVKSLWCSRICDVLIEWIKIQSVDGKEDMLNRHLMLLSIDTCLHLIHPLAPEISEVIWQNFNVNNSTALAYQKYPTVDLINFVPNENQLEMERNFENMLDVVSKINYYLQILKISKKFLRNNDSSVAIRCQSDYLDSDVISRLSGIPTENKQNLIENPFLLEIDSNCYIELDRSKLDLSIKDLESNLVTKLSTLKSQVLKKSQTKDTKLTEKTDDKIKDFNKKIEFHENVLRNVRKYN